MSRSPTLSARSACRDLPGYAERVKAMQAKLDELRG
jgi:hypothetical protein